jgi:hypothetical protein
MVSLLPLRIRPALRIRACPAQGQRRGGGPGNRSGSTFERGRDLCFLAVFSEERRPRRNRSVAPLSAALLLVSHVRAEEGAYLLLDPALLADEDVAASLQ